MLYSFAVNKRDFCLPIVIATDVQDHKFFVNRNFVLLKYIFPRLTLVDFPHTLAWTGASLRTGPETLKGKPLIETSEIKPNKRKHFQNWPPLQSRSKQLCKLIGCLGSS